MSTVFVVGAGASGMMAALTAAEQPDNRVILFERQQRVGRKLLATGNGRCNLTNTGASPANYHGEHSGFADNALRRFPPEVALEFFHSLGLMTVEERGGRVYPLSDSANSVVDVLRFALDRAGVETRAASPAREIKRKNGGFLLSVDEGELFCDYLIVACGGPAGKKLGGVTDGFSLLAPLGHQRTKLYPALVQLMTAPDYPRALKGVRADAHVKLLSGSTVLAESVGELQFTDKGVSGPAIFDISRCASVSSCPMTVTADFMREYRLDEVFALLTRRREKLPELQCQELFTGMLHNRLGKMLVKYSGIAAADSIGALNDSRLRTAANACKDFALPLIGTEGFESAQVTAGGLKTEDFDSATLESRLAKGLFVCGELLDVDGDCGGYNLQWAWASGRLAGRLGK